jgi:hypothetical protein
MRPQRECQVTYYVEDRARNLGLTCGLDDRISPSTSQLSFNMATVPDEGSAPAIRFKRRKTAHPKRVYGDEDIPTTSETEAPGAAMQSSEVPTLPTGPGDEDDTIPNLKEIIRNRRRPRDRPKDATRKPEVPKAELVPVEAPREGLFTGRFVAQTGQVVDKDDKQM